MRHTGSSWSTEPSGGDVDDDDGVDGPLLTRIILACDWYEVQEEEEEETIVDAN